MEIATYKIITCPKILTMNSAQPKAEAVCVLNCKICCVGTKAEVLAFVGDAPHEETTFTDGILCPGFIDTHSHLSMYAQCRTQFYCDNAYGSLENILHALREYAKARPDDAWVRGYCYDDTGFPDGRHLTRQDLDSICSDRPVFIAHITCHLGYLNTLGLKLLGITAATDIPGGVVSLDAQGQPNGLVKENTFMHVLKQVPAVSGKDLVDAMEAAIADYNRQGFTMFQDGGIGISSGSDEILAAYNELAREKRLHARAYLHFFPAVLDTLVKKGLWDIEINEHVYYGGVKYFSDGSIQSFTAVLKDPYLNSDFCGNVVTSPEDMANIICKYHSQNIPVAIHANGDKAIEDVVCGFEKALAAYPVKVKGHMIIHAQMASDAQLERLRNCGVTPTFFVRHVTVWGDRHVERFLGVDRASRLNPLGSCVRLNMPFALHVDTPVQPVSALDSMYTAVTRRTTGGRILGAEQRVAPIEALKAYTVYAAKCSGLEDKVGRVAPGLYADFVHLSANPEEVSPDAIKDIHVKHTICGGDIVFDAARV